MRFRSFFFSANISFYCYMALFMAMPQYALAGSNGGISLSLADAVMMALDKNRGLSVSEKRAEAAQAIADAATGRLLPRIDASYVVSRTDLPINVFGDKLLQKRFTAKDFSITSLNNPDSINNYHTDISVTVPVYQGGALWAGKRAGEAGAAAAQWQHRARQQAVILEIIEAFATLRQAEAQRTAAGQALNAARNHLQNTRALERRGMAISSDVMDALAHKLQVGVILQSATDAVATAHDRLQRLLGMRPGTPFTTRGNADFALPEKDMHNWVQVATASRPDLVAGKQRVNTARARADAARAPFRPAIDIQATQEWNSNTAAPKNGNATIAANLRLNLFAGGTDRAKLRATQTKLEIRQTELADLKQRIHNEVQATWRNLDEARSRLAANDQVLQQTQESLRIRRLREQQGLEKVSDVLDAQSRADHARAEAIRARYALIIAKARLLAAAGQLTPEVIQ